jgi:hypothetical protein
MGKKKEPMSVMKKRLFIEQPPDGFPFFVHLNILCLAFWPINLVSGPFCLTIAF